MKALTSKCTKLSQVPPRQPCYQAAEVLMRQQQLQRKQFEDLLALEQQPQDSGAAVPPAGKAAAEPPGAGAEVDVA